MISSDVIKAIYEYGFVNSPYPIVLSIENHCSYEQQKTLAKIMVDVLKETLALPMKNIEPGTTLLPSPKDLMRRVLIKGKRASDVAEDDEDEEEDDEDDEDEDEEEDLENADQDSSAKKARRDSKNVSKTAVLEGKKSKSGTGAAPPSKTHPDLSAITYLGTGKVKSFAAHLSNAVPCDMMCSYSEGTTGKYMKDANRVTGWIEHNKSHLRSDSSFNVFRWFLMC